MIDAGLYKNARVTPISLTYYGFCLENGKYRGNLHFAEIMFTDDQIYSRLGRRLFDVYIQGKRVLENFNIVERAGGVGKAVIEPFTTDVTNNTLEIRFYWAGKGTTAIPYKSVYGPLISAISAEYDPKNGISTGAVVGIVLGGAVIVIVVFGILWWRGCIGRRSSLAKDLEGLHLRTGIFTFKEIKAATNNFNTANKIGEGGFGPVYKGILPNGTIIAVKQLSTKSKQGNREFINEIGMISALQHPYLVKLYGCCVEGDQLLLIYEFMDNNSLARALFGLKEFQLKLDWPTRHKICIGIARGLAFLHEESRLKIVHRDIKATNVLLDKDLNPKISDFGLAKLVEEDNTHISTRIAGTYGYMAPEYAMHGYLTDKADVYSFGIVALEIVSGRVNTIHRAKEEAIYLLDGNLASSLSSSGTNATCCFKKGLLCPRTPQYNSLFINCGGPKMKFEGNECEEDPNPNGISYFNIKDDKWAYSSTGTYIFNDKADYVTSVTKNKFSLIVNGSEYYQTARLSPSSLKYYGLCMLKGNYKVKLHFVEIMFSSDQKFSSLGTRIFDVSIQGLKCLKDFNITKEAGGVGKGITKEFDVDVNDTTLEIHLYWTGKGTTSIPTRGVYGPLISTITMMPNFKVPSQGLCVDNQRNDKGFSARAIVGIMVGLCLFLIVVLLIILRKNSFLDGKNSQDIDLKGLDLKTGIFTLKEIKAATNNFNADNKIGEGGFGPVYKAHQLKDGGNLMDLVDPKLGEDFNREEIMTVIDVALQCTENSPKLRPTMSKMLSILEGRPADLEVVSDDESEIMDDDLKLKLVMKEEADKDETNQAINSSSHESQTTSQPFSEFYSASKDSSSWEKTI
ncbi:probable LRR receptor-like serine/threonine-protein kinase At1g53440 isoform X1 [Neltuma alba]|uniref:probable LRR receptor-like serine/threonine-protein kinase At1g53440 isoform X1 n=1 Tax=Neltuma alba TaxID=207710 RepID=UPI0010A4E0C9|nr:probable LRR receptor-like serine/threonine-protein kinase At1g53440 isoform X1 [Prosopis alba]